MGMYRIKFYRIVLSISFLLPFVIEAQTYLMQNGTTTDCGGVFYDPAGDVDPYTDDLDLVYTICPIGNGLKTEIQFGSFDLGTGDTLCIYDGDNAGAPLFGCFTGTALSGALFTANFDCLTFHFKSDDDGVTGFGWEASIDCANCQTILPAANYSATQDNVTGFIDICVGETIDFEANPEFPESGLNYDQSLATSNVEWNFFLSTSTDNNVSLEYGAPGYYPVYLTVTDVNGCSAESQIAAVRVSGNPLFNGTTASDLEICEGYPFQLLGQAQTQEYTFVYGDLGNETFLADGSGVSYTSDLNINEFNIGQTITDVSQIEAICINMEHSYMGDLVIEVECPDGSTVLLHNQGGGSTFLGEPYEDDDGCTTDCLPGIGYDYCFTPLSNNGTWIDNNNSGVPLPAGDYEPVEDFSALEGCPLNGTWTLHVADNLFSDNGFIFGWYVQFDADLYPTTVPSFQPTIVNSEWSIDNTVLGTGDVVDAVANPVGTQEFIYTVEDDFGCEWSTTVEVEVLAGPQANFEFENTCFDAQPIQFNNSSTSSNVNSTITNYSWSFGSGIGSSQPNPSVIFPTSGTQNVTLEVTDSEGCIGETTMSVEVYPVPVANFSNDPACINGGSITFQDLSSVPGGTIDQWFWNFGDGNVQIDTDGSIIEHSYQADNIYYTTLIVTSSKGCKDTITKQVEVYEKPNSFFVADKYEDCTPLCLSTTNVSTSLTTSISRYEWQFGNGAISFEEEPSYCYTESGYYDLMLIVQNNFGCLDTLIREVFAKPLPEAAFNYQPIEYLTSLNPKAKFLDKTKGSVTWRWFVEGDLISNIQNPFHIFDDAGDYDVTLITSNIHECYDTTSRTITVKPFYNFFVPSSFSPNGDNINDIFAVIGNGIKNENYEFILFNRWGDIVWEADNINDTWDGKINGSNAKQDVYQYKLSFFNFLEEREIHYGQVTLIR